MYESLTAPPTMRLVCGAAWAGRRVHSRQHGRQANRDVLEIGKTTDQQ